MPCLHRPLAGVWQGRKDRVERRIGVAEPVSTNRFAVSGAATATCGATKLYIEWRTIVVLRQSDQTLDT